MNYNWNNCPDTIHVNEWKLKGTNAFDANISFNWIMVAFVLHFHASIIAGLIDKSKWFYRFNPKFISIKILHWASTFAAAEKNKQKPCEMPWVNQRSSEWMSIKKRVQKCPDFYWINCINIHMHRIVTYCATLKIIEMPSHQIALHTQKMYVPKERKNCIFTATGKLWWYSVS